jgi:hypothetical protein
MQELGLSWSDVAHMPAKASLALRVLLSAKAQANDTENRWATREQRQKGAT